MKTQRDKILHLLKDLGTTGLNSFEWRHLAYQLPTRIFELKKTGHLITTKHNTNGSVTYYLIQERKQAEIPQLETPKWIFEGGIARMVTKPQQEILL